MNRSWLFVGLLLAPTLSGCLGFGASGEGDESASGLPDEGGVRQAIERTLTFDLAASIDQPSTQRPTEVTLGMFEIEPDQEILEFFYTFTWDVAAHRWTIISTLPNGTTVSIPASQGFDTRTVYDLQQGNGPLRPGEYHFQASNDNGALVPDALRLQATVKIREWTDTQGDAATDEPDEPDDAPETPADDEWTYREVNNGWRASRTSTLSAAATTPTTTFAMDISTFNGAVDVTGGSGNAVRADVTVWGEGKTKADAARAAESIQVSSRVSPSELSIRASTTNGTRRGVDVDASVPLGPEYRGGIHTTNGRMSVDGLRLAGFELESTNGGITARVEALDDLRVELVNGQIDLAIRPVGTLRLDVSGVNSQMEIGLDEGDDIGYRLTAGGTNSVVTSNMREAELSGSQGSYVLETRDRAGRTVQVTGDVSTVNGPIAFSSA